MILNKRNVYLGLLIIWMLLIFYFSHQTGEESAVLSDNFLIRKMAHKVTYAILYLLSYLFFKTNNYLSKIKQYLKPLLFCFIYACSDELHQFFIVGRVASFIDIGIDVFGAIVMMLLIFIIKYNLDNKKVQ